MSEKQLTDINEKLDQLIRLAAQHRAAACDSKKDQILMLGQAGMDRNLIADICGTSPNTVSVVLSKAKHKVKGKK